MKVRKYIGLEVLILLILVCPFIGSSQSFDHWEAVVVAENEWKYQVGDSEPSQSWMQLAFDDNSWLTGKGGIGYGDGDDETIISPAHSVYLRRQFEIIDTSLIALLSLYADYDDAFVAYLNGVEICRANIGIAGVAPVYNDPVDDDREALLYQGGLPEAFPIAKTLLNNGNNILAVKVHNDGLGSSDLSSLIFLLAGITDSSDNYQPVPSWFTEPFTSSNIPIFVINTEGQAIVDEPKIVASLGVIDNGDGNLNLLTDSYNGYNGKIGVEIRGSSSQNFPKKNYGFETRLADGENNNVSLLGLPKENDWILYGPYSDKSLMRNVLSFHIGRLTGEYASRTRWCELVIDGEYKGLYVLMEKIKRDKNRVDISKLKVTDTTGVDLTGGYIFSVDREEDGPLTGWASPYNNKPFYRYRDPNYDELLSQQKTYLEDHITLFEEAVDNSTSSEAFTEYIDVPSFVNYWIATEMFKHIDNYKFSFFMYKTRDDKGGKIHFGPLWDLNLAYGNYDFGQDPGPEGWSYVWASLPFLRPSWIVDLSEDEEIKNQINCRWSELRQNRLRTDSLLQFIDTQAATIEDARIRNFNRWPILGTYVWPNEFIGQDYAEELDYLKTWLTDRLEWMDDNMVGFCDPSTSLGEELERSEIVVYPNPFESKVTFDFKYASSHGYKISLFDVLGRAVLVQELEQGLSVQLSLESFPKGMYFFQVSKRGLLVHSGKLVREE
ncbi:MAG: hypothetical protein ACI9P5_002586 [Saprospiraceae bacterium]|jgi:hypothetical protein